MSEYRQILDQLTEGRDLPEGCDAWAFRAVYADFSSSRGYRWPFPGNWAAAPGPIDEGNTDARPSDVGDGICVARTYGGMASGCIPASTILLCAYRREDVLGEDAHEVRVRRAYVVDVLDGAKVLRKHGAGVDLRNADLRNADLHRADLRNADLYFADLRGANLEGADLGRANLLCADLRGANLERADLYRADLAGTLLVGANLGGAVLHRADLAGSALMGTNLYAANLCAANLRHADLHRADLRNADLHRADLRNADLNDADLTGALLMGAKLPDALKKAQK